MEEVCERCGEVSECLDDNLVCWDCHESRADMLYELEKERQ